jgi:hypothetical protein
MSFICPASSRTLALDEEDLHEIRHKPHRTKTIKQDIDIGLECEISFEDDRYPNGKLRIDNWNYLTRDADLCGVCNFCSIVLHALQQTLSSKNCNWDLKGYGPNAEKRTPRGLDIMLTELLFPNTPTTSTDHDNSSLSGLDIMVLRGEGEAFDVAHRKMPLGERGTWSKIEVAFEFFGNENDQAVDSLNIRRRPLQSEPLSAQNVAKVRQWMDDCDEHHTRCRPDSLTLSIAGKAEEEYFRPTRLLHIGVGAKQIRLIHTAGLPNIVSGPKKIHYMALSYCWGSPSTSEGLLTTTHESMHSRMQGIDVSIMPQAFKDAIAVGRSLEIEYLWIDSLCIIQDDSNDWERESSKMAEIFSSAYLTVIAAQGSSCHDSFFERHLHHSKITVPISWRVPQGYTTRDWQISLRFRRPGTDKMSQLAESRWATRGWTFQEERLARRALIFGEEKIFLDCRTLERVEDIVAARKRPDWVSSLMKLDTKIESEDVLARNGSNEARSLYEHWQVLCRQYTYRELTFPADKLPAISGMARKIAQGQTSDTEYLAGLWKGDLMHCLFWYPTKRGKELKNYRAPSWSWASLDGGISWLDWRSRSRNGCQTHCTILDVQTTPLGLYTLGAVKDGYLRVVGPMLKVELSWSNWPGHHSPAQYHWYLSYQGMEVARSIPDTLGEAGTLAMDTENIWALLFETYKGDKGGRLVSRGILLKSNGRKRDDLEVFQRIGIFKTFDEEFINDPNSTAVWDGIEKRTIVII